MNRKYLFLIPILALAMVTFVHGGLKEHALCYPKQGLVRIYVGKQAIEMVKSIHWHPKALKGLVNATVAFYSDGSILWEAEAENVSTAKTLIDEMVNAIRSYQGELPYLIPVKHEINGTQVYFIADVRGPIHVLFRKGKLLIWLEMGRNGLRYLSELLKCK